MWNLLNFKEKFNLSGQVVHKSRKDIKKSDEVRLFMYKLKDPQDIIYNICETISHIKSKGIGFSISCIIRCFGDLPSWIGKYCINIDKEIFNENMIEVEIEDNDGNSDNSIKIFSENSSISIQINFGSNANCKIEKILNHKYFSVKLNLIRKEDRVVGTMELIFVIDRRDYELLINKRLSVKYNLVDTNIFDTIRAVYRIDTKKQNNYMGTLIDKFLSKDSEQMDPPTTIKFHFRSIYQYVSNCNFSKIVYLGSPIKNVTNWSGRCFDPIVKNMIDVNDTIRCKLSYHKVNSTKIYEIGRLYFKVLKLENDHFYGELQEVYNQGKSEYELSNYKMPLQYSIIRLPNSCISEIPITWLSTDRELFFRQYLLNKGYAFTGATVV